MLNTGDSLASKPELSIIKLFLQYEYWNKYAASVNVEWFDKDLKVLYRCLNSHYTVTQDPKDLTVDDLSLLLFSNTNQNLEYLQGVLSHLKEMQIQPELAVSYINSLYTKQKLLAVALLAYEVSEGKKPSKDLEDLLAEKSVFDTNNTVLEEEEIFTPNSLLSLLDKQQKEPGLRWRLSALNKSLGPLRKGDAGLVFARVETGKTTFLCSEVSYFLTQLNGENCLFINNEEQNEKVVMRLIQGYFGVPYSELIKHASKYDKEFIEHTKNSLRFVGGLEYSNRKTIEKLCRQLNPKLIVIDQTDKIQGFVNDREDLRLGAIYQWTRELAKEYGPTINVCQADGTGENVRYLTMSNVSNSKTSKAAELDWILGIGTTHDSGWEAIRFLNISKNKLVGDENTDPSKRHGKFEVIIQPDIARYKDM